MIIRIPVQTEGTIKRVDIIDVLELVMTYEGEILVYEGEILTYEE